MKKIIAFLFCLFLSFSVKAITLEYEYNERMDFLLDSVEKTGSLWHVYKLNNYEKIDLEVPRTITLDSNVYGEENAGEYTITKIIKYAFRDIVSNLKSIKLPSTIENKEESREACLCLVFSDISNENWQEIMSLFPDSEEDNEDDYKIFEVKK